MTQEHQIQMFGGPWTEQKLEVLKRYIFAYVTALKKQPYELIYVDGFAGAGYSKTKACKRDAVALFPIPEEAGIQSILEGSPRIALQAKPPFYKYVFIDKSKKRTSQLQHLREESPSLSAHIRVVHTDCNRYVTKLCRILHWKRRRGLIFLDPFGTQLNWTTLEHIALTKALDAWILFPLNAVMRFLRNTGRLPDRDRIRLDSVFGANDWYDIFYESREDLFGTSSVHKKANFGTIAEYWISRLKTVFPYVLEDPLKLCNRRSHPLFLLCFAVANPNPAAIRLAARIAENVVNRKR